MPAPDGRFRLLILGGTAEAAAFARGVADRWGGNIDMITALAGRLGRRPNLAGRMRVGGFGGTDGLTTYIKDESIDAMVDATHPFAAIMSAHAEEAAERTTVPRLVLCRPPWQSQAGDDWRTAPNIAEAARLVPTIGSRAFLTTGIGGLDAFAAARGAWFLVRLMAPPKEALPLAQCETVIGRPPYKLEDERRLIGDYNIAVTVSKNSGGVATEAKLTAAREAGIPVIMVERPQPPGGEIVADVDTALSWIAARIGR
ncbi:MAG: cobalt-precorrin-6A reductase [Proteobacteria bacterium]|nr:cobalt-precorrin-6A reductase [Pseudomonadota bacterium]